MFKCCFCFAKTYEAPEIFELNYRHASLVEVPSDVFQYERTLERLDLGSNQIADLPPSLFHCHELKELDLCDNDLMTIPQAVGSLTRLQKLDLSRNSITEISDSIKNCKNLAYLDLSMNHLVKLPEGISQLVTLEQLFLNDTYLEFLHANFGRLVKLTVLELRENSLQNLPKSMSRLTHLQRLDIGQNDFSEMPEVLGAMTNLNEFWCDSNGIREIPKFIGNLTKLNCFDAATNDIQFVSDELSKCFALTDVTLCKNNIKCLPNSFCQLENLSVLRMDNNSIEFLPEEFGQLKSLQEVSMVSNLLKKLPASIGLLRRLHTAYLDHNLLTEIPKEIGSCLSLSVLTLARNRLNEIPSEIGHLSNLKVLSLYGNCIRHLPVSMLNIPKLGALWLTESQNKPIFPLNQEVDESTGQHVLTCYLLPQLPRSREGFGGPQSQPCSEPREDKPARRSRPSIKFMTENDVISTETTVGKRGLLRAPTPYPKELRALAKHASNIRHSKEANGEVVSSNEPEYEGDFPEEKPTVHHALPKSDSGPAIGYNSAVPTMDGSHNVMRCKLNPSQDVYENISAEADILPSNVSNSIPHASLESSEILKAKETITTDVLKHNNIPDQIHKITKENYGSAAVSDIAKKSPPPYHVAARRAAFFRSSGGAGSGKMDTVSDNQTQSNPLPVIRMFPVMPSQNSQDFQPHKQAEPVSDGHPDNNIDKVPETALNQTYTVESHKDDTEESEDSAEGSLDILSGAANIDLSKDSYLNTNNLVKTIETALESVDKKTTEFLKDDKWDQPESGVRDAAMDGVSHLKPRCGYEEESRLPAIPPKPNVTLAIRFNSPAAPKSVSKIPTAGVAPKAKSTFTDVVDNEPMGSVNVTFSNSTSRIPKGPQIAYAQPVDSYKKPELSKTSSQSKIPFLAHDLKKINQPNSHDLPDGSGKPGSPDDTTVVPRSKSTSKIPKYGDSISELKRNNSGTRIPKLTENNYGTILDRSPSVDNSCFRENNNEQQISTSSLTSGSRIPSIGGRKPWIFGTHKNARVISVEYHKINELGFSINDGKRTGHVEDSQGIYVDGTDQDNLTIQTGDKILQIDGIDVSNMGVEIVRKILSNCQETINILVSRQG